MFANAYKLASSFTRPVIVSIRFFDKTVDCICGAFIVVNDEGWIITVGHLWKPHFVYQKHSKEISDYRKRIRAIQGDKSLDNKRKRKRIGRLKTESKWITNLSFWWGSDGAQLKNIKPLPDGDLVIGQLDPFDSKTIKAYPIFKDPTNLAPGTSLCKLGYPFHKVEATFNETNSTFELAQGVLPMPFFPIEGIFTRNVMAGKSKDGKYDIKFLETSSPGLKGQSGGPVFDVKGTIWAVQSRTENFSLGFSPKIVKRGREVEEHQFLSVGWGIHAELMVAFLKDNNIKFNLSDY